MDLSRSTRATLAELARQVRRDTLRIFEAAQPNWLTYAPPGTSNHILWHAGHALWLQDVLCIRVLTGREELPAGWAEKFGMNCRPPSHTTDWPGRYDVRELLQQQLLRILQLLATNRDQRLAAKAEPASGAGAISEHIIHGFHDEAKHSGEMYLILKLCRANF